MIDKTILTYAMNIYERFNSTCIIDIDNLNIDCPDGYLHFNTEYEMLYFFLTEIDCITDMLEGEGKLI